MRSEQKVDLWKLWSGFGLSSPDFDPDEVNWRRRRLNTNARGLDSDPGMWKSRNGTLNFENDAKVETSESCDFAKQLYGRRFWALGFWTLGTALLCSALVSLVACKLMTPRCNQKTGLQTVDLQARLWQKCVTSGCPVSNVLLLIPSSTARSNNEVKVKTDALISNEGWRTLLVRTRDIVHTLRHPGTLARSSLSNYEENVRKVRQHSSDLGRDALKGV
jgi:hypothetical protein